MCENRDNRKWSGGDKVNQPYSPYYYTGAPYQPQIGQAPYQDRLAQLQSQYQNTMPQTQNPGPPQTNQGLLWVQGEAAAKSYLVAPNTTVLLLDSEGSRFYLKSTDNAGMPNLRTFEYREVPQNAPQAQQAPAENLDDKYVTRDEYKSLQAQCKDMMDKINNFHVAEDEQPKRVTTKNRGGNAGE